jgi:hypothetical protein
MLRRLADRAAEVSDQSRPACNWAAYLAGCGKMQFWVLIAALDDW